MAHQHTVSNTNQISVKGHQIIVEQCNCGAWRCPNSQPPTLDRTVPGAAYAAYLCGGWETEMTINKAHLLGGFDNIPKSTLDACQARRDAATLHVSLHLPDGYKPEIWYNAETDTWECMDSRIDDATIRANILRGSIVRGDDNHVLLACLFAFAPCPEANEFVAKCDEINLLIKHNSWGAAEDCQNQLAFVIERWKDTFPLDVQSKLKNISIRNMLKSFSETPKCLREDGR